MNTKEYGYRELIYDECFSSGKEFTREQLMKIVNERLEQRDFKPIQSRTTFMQDMQELMFYADRLVVKSPAYFRDAMRERLEWCMNSYKNVEKGKSWTAGVESQLFAFNYIHESKDDWHDIHYRICIGQSVLNSCISDYSNDWKYIRSSLERIIDHSQTVIELNNDDEPTKIELKKNGDMLDVLVTPDSITSKDQLPIYRWVRMKDAVRELYNGLMECAKAFPKEYVDGCPFTFDVVYDALKSEKIENYLKEE